MAFAAASVIVVAAVAVARPWEGPAACPPSASHPEWSVARRALHGLDQRIGFWTISSEVHARKPDEPIFRAFLKTVGIASKRVAFVDDRQVNIAAAEALGFKTILVDFAAAGNDPRAIRSVDQLGEALAELRATD